MSDRLPRPASPAPRDAAAPRSASSPPSRRAFLATTARTAGVVGLAAACSGCAWFHKKDIDVRAAPEATSIRLAFADHAALKTPNGFVRVSARDGDLRILVVRLADGRAVAASMECTHWGCDLDWSDARGDFECPCHGSRFDPAGKVLEGPADDPLPTWPVREDADGLTIDLAPT
jgi:Rieske Fe-S protein